MSEDKIMQEWLTYAQNDLTAARYMLVVKKGSQLRESCG
jgi:hypothetical protein